MPACRTRPAARRRAGPRSFFSWIVGLATTARVDLVIGLAVLSLLRSVMRRTTRIVPVRGYRADEGERHDPPAS
jgi:hypothetical protein